MHGLRSSKQLASVRSRPPRLNPSVLLEPYGRLYSSPSQTPASTSSASPNSSSSKAAQRTRAGSRPISLLEKYAPRLHAVSTRTGVPLPSLGVSFLILHEITALVPVLILFFVFQALGAGTSLVAWLAETTTTTAEHTVAGAQRGWDWRAIAHEWIVEGEKKVEGVGRRYGVLGYAKRAEGETRETDAAAAKAQGRVSRFEDPDAAGQMVREAKDGGPAAGVVDAIAAYVVVKALLPVRIGISLAAAPSFARLFLEPVRRYGNSYKQRTSR